MPIKYAVLVGSEGRNLMVGADRQRAGRALKLQLVVSVIIPAALIIFDQHVALSALAGAAVAVLGSFLFAAMVFSGYSAADPGALMRRLYLAELLKLAAVMLAFGILFAQWREVAFVPLIVTFLLVYLVPGLVVSKRPSGKA